MQEEQPIKILVQMMQKNAKEKIELKAINHPLRATPSPSGGVWTLILLDTRWRPVLNQTRRGRAEPRTLGRFAHAPLPIVAGTWGGVS